MNAVCCQPAQSSYPILHLTTDPLTERENEWLCPECGMPVPEPEVQPA